MSDLQEPNPNISALASLYPEGKYPSHIDVFGKGGFVALNDEIGLSGYDEFINERIRFLRRKSGMLVYISSDETYHRCLTAGSDETDGQWKREYFTGRYFHGPSAPTADDLQMGERWFDTVVGTEYTYIPIAEGSTYLEWVDMDHLGTGRKYFYGLTAPEAGTDGDPLNIGDKWFNSTVGSEFTYLPTDGTLTGNKQWIDIDSPGSKGEEVLDIWVNESGDTMTGTLTGPHLNFDTGFIATLTGNIADFGHITADTGFIGTLTGNYIDIPSLGDFGSQIRVASNSSLGMPYFSGSMHSLDLWSRLHLIGGGGQTGYSLRITTSAAGSTIEDSQGKMIFDQGFTHGVAISAFGINDIFDPTFPNPIAGISFFGTNLYTGQNNRTDTSMPYQGLTNNQYSGMLTLEMDGRGYIPRMFSTRRGDLLNTFDDNEFITKLYAENNFGSGDIEITNGTNNSDPFSPYNWELTKIVLGRTDDNGTLLKSIYKIEPQVISNGNLAGNNITLNFSYLCGSSTYDLLDIGLDVTKNNTYESYGDIYYTAFNPHTEQIDKRFVSSNGAIKISYSNDSPRAWFNNTIYLSCLFKI